MKASHQIPVVGGPFDGMIHALTSDPAECVTIEPQLTFDADTLRVHEGLPPLGGRRIAVYHLVATGTGWKFVFDRIKSDNELLY